MLKNFHDKNLNFKANKANRFMQCLKHQVRSTNFLKYHNWVRCAFRLFQVRLRCATAIFCRLAAWNDPEYCELQKSNPKFKLNPCWCRLAHEKITKTIKRRSLAHRKSLSFDLRPMGDMDSTLGVPENRNDWTGNIFNM